MEHVGWEMRPLGWIALVALILLFAFFQGRRLQPPPDNPKEPSLS